MLTPLPAATTTPPRDDLMRRWVASCQARGIPTSPDCTLRGTLASPVEVRQSGKAVLGQGGSHGCIVVLVPTDASSASPPPGRPACTHLLPWQRKPAPSLQVRDWVQAGLPTDDVSVDNGVLVTRCKRWPLIIDPQGQATSWLRALEARNALRVIKRGDANYLRTLEGCIRVGAPILLGARRKGWARQPGSCFNTPVATEWGPPTVDHLICTHVQRIKLLAPSLAYLPFPCLRQRTSGRPLTPPWSLC
jgi:hypothetical protein